jgi:hypothetical protein
MWLVIFYYFFTKRKQNKTKKIIKYYQPRQLVVGLLWEMSVGIISHKIFVFKIWLGIMKKKKKQITKRKDYMLLFEIF